jgi:hypothetical protein
MSSIEPSLGPWGSLQPSQRIEIGLVQVRIAYHRRLCLDYDDQDMQRVREVVRDGFYTIAEHFGGKLFAWNGEKCSFMFLIEGAESYDNCCLAAVQMLEMIPALSQDIRSAHTDQPISVRISCDTGLVTYDPEASRPQEFVGRLSKHELQISAPGQAVITERLYQRLCEELRSRFTLWKHSDELGIELYSTGSPPATGPVADLPEFGPPAEVEKPAAASAAPSDGMGMHPGQLARGSRWVLAGALAAAMLLAGAIIGRVFAPSHPEAVIDTGPGWQEPVRDPEWTSWRARIHEKLSAAPITEQTLIEAFQIRPPVRPEDQAAALRRDQAIADVFLSYQGVQPILKARFGIDNRNFLGTGLSKPVGKNNYSSASVHEYLIPNYPDTHPEVWTWKIKPVGLLFGKRVCDFIAGEGDMRSGRVAPSLGNKSTFDQYLTDVILPRVKGRDMDLPPVIRFAKFPEQLSSNKLGRKEAVRVFASNLAEVWDHTLQDAARLSGYPVSTTASDADTFFIWIFVPVHPDDVVPATWGQVLNNLPKWMKDAPQKP